MNGSQLVSVSYYCVMKKNRALKIFKKLHKWPAIVIAFFAIIFAVSGIIMNHRDFFSTIDVSRKLLPPNYTYNNWNLAAVRGSLQTAENEILIYGNVGIWKSDGAFQHFSDFNQGFPKGIDNRKIYSVVQLGDELFAGTHMGLFSRNKTGREWEKVQLPVRETRIADIGLKNDTLLVLTRHYLLKSADGKTFETVQLPAPEGYERKAGLFETFWQLHSGELFGLAGKLIVDLLGLVTIFLSVSGLLHFFFPKMISKRKKKAKEISSLVSAKKTNLHWHNVAGYIFVFFLIINTFSGIHLRPPLLIAIANKQVGIIPGTHMDSPNPWFDKLRRVHWDEDSKHYIFSTSDGFYFAGETLTQPLQPALSQPPVSVMGCNVMKPLGNKILLVGSFSGMFLWNIETGAVADFFTQKPFVAPEGMQSPIGSKMAAGLVEGNENAFWFDYNSGAQTISSQARVQFFPEMPEEILKTSPMSLWNVALELHTGRIFEYLIGPFYILIVPIAGICILLVLISGFMLWWKVYRKTKGSK